MHGAARVWRRKDSAFPPTATSQTHREDHEEDEDDAAAALVADELREGEVVLTEDKLLHGHTWEAGRRGRDAFVGGCLVSSYPRGLGKPGTNARGRCKRCSCLGGGVRRGAA